MTSPGSDLPPSPESPAPLPVPRSLAISELGAGGAGSVGQETFSALGRWIGNLVDAGVEAMQLREKDLADRELLRLARHAVETADGRLAVLINGRPDIARLAGADGVHLPAAGLPFEAGRRILGSRALVGRSTHTLEEVTSARREGADYVTFGPVWPTPSKAAFGAPAGPRLLARAAGLGVPVLALGGVDLDRLEAAARAGAHGVAAIRALHDPPGLVQMAAKIRRLWTD